MPFETSPKPEQEPEQEQDTAEIGSYHRAEVLRKVAEKQIAEAKNFEDLNRALVDMGDITIEGSIIEYSGSELQARITDLRDAVAEVAHSSISWANL